MKKITNPILPGFNPDPSILRVDDDYYIATSTFEWFPGVQIHHSKDLIHWELVAHPLNRITQLDMRGNPISGGIWAPCLSYDKGVFYLIYTDVKLWYGDAFRDLSNYLVTSTSITGEWSDPIFLNSSGFDPSLFHDGEKKYLVNQQWDFRLGNNSFSGIVLQEYSLENQKLVGPIINIYKGTELKLVEGPHLYKHNDFYYLMVAEGGTRFEHAVTLARSRQLEGPYETHPQNPILTSWQDATLVLQRAGHASLVHTQSDEWYMVHLCGRPLPNRGNCILGRETAIQKMIWKDDWLYLASGGNKPQLVVDAPNLPEWDCPKPPSFDDFDNPRLGIHYQSLRIPLGEDLLSLTERPGFLRLKGKESILSPFQQSLVGRRQQAFCYTATTMVEFDPDCYMQLAGMTAFYDHRHFYYLYLSNDEKLGKVLGVYACKDGVLSEPMGKPVPCPLEQCYMRIEVDFHLLQFSYSADGKKYTPLLPKLDASILSDEAEEPNKFTGTFIALCCQDLSGRRKAADFDFFEYVER